jgi:hypothetical protein
LDGRGDGGGLFVLDGDEGQLCLYAIFTNNFRLKIDQESAGPNRAISTRIINLFGWSIIDHGWKKK